MRRFLLIVFAMFVVTGAVIFFQPGGYLIVNNAQKSDAIIVLGGDQADARYFHALELLRTGYGQHLIVDATTGITYGHSYADLAADFVAHTAGPNLPQVSVCPIPGDSTKAEAALVNQCLERLTPRPHSVLLVTDDYHTRRALSILRNRLPQYQWTAAAASNHFLYGLPWWKDREWAKTYFTEWQKLLYWQLVDRWRN